MPYVLKHSFDPDFDHLHLKPKDNDGERVDHFNLGYAQNVRKGHVLAEWEEVSPRQAAALDGRFIFKDKHFPAGANCFVHPKNPDKLLAAADGYVFYLDGKITVKSELNVRGGVDFRTGNIDFVADVVVHGPVRSGFSVSGRNVQVKDVVEAAEVKASGNIDTEAGFKGNGSGLLEAGDKIKVSFCENAQLRSGGNIVVRHSCLHCSIYCGGSLAVQGALMGGDIYSRGLVYVGDVLGGGLGVETRLVLGYAPKLFLEAERLDENLREVLRRLSNHRPGKGTKSPGRDGKSDDSAALAQRFKTLLQAKRELWTNVCPVESIGSCRVVVPGEVRPGVEISIGEAFLRIDRTMRNVVFLRRDKDIVIASPALQGR
ncbi:FapA family protein [Desulfocurvibacter africanus]|uniref:FapA family protein n=1 Tax=Desulfocurvibacter africanus TaxID=873 RepID=UPI000412B9D2|nr:FapA family protein [Desulfocurvibacter africanus]